MPEYYKGLFSKGYGDPANPVVLFIHGFMGDGRDWSEIIRKVSVSYYCLTIDLPGHGKSLNSHLLDDYADFASLSKEINNILSRFSINNVHLAGYSMGGRVAQHFATDFPDRIIKLILESSSFGIKDEGERAQRLQTDIRLSEQLKNGSYRHFLEHWYKQPLFAAIQQNPGYPDLIKRRLGNNPLLLSRALVNYSSGSQSYLESAVLALNKPLMMLCGEKDEKYQQMMQSIKQKKKEISLKVIESAGHNTHFEKPNLFAEHLLEFLSL